MRYVIIAVRDSAAEAFSVPQFYASHGVALRGFTDEVNRKDDKNPFYVHAEDFEMYSLGEYDDGTGQFVLNEQPRQIARGKDLRREV